MPRAPKKRKPAGGHQGWFATMRPRGGIQDKSIKSVLQYTRKHCMWWFIVKEKDGEDGHLHCVFISRRCVQRSNIISGYLKHPLADWDDASKENLRHWDVAKCTGAWKPLTSLNVITDYLSGNRESKKGDAYQVISSELPEDLSELEKYIPDVGELKRPKKYLVSHTP